MQRPGRLRSARGPLRQRAGVQIAELLRESGDLQGDPKPITHNVKFYEKGDRPLEIVTSRQWFIKTIDHRENSSSADEISWHPAYAGAFRELGGWPERRLVHQPPAILRRAVPGVVSDSRQRQHRLRERDGGAGAAAASRSSTDVPDGYTADQRGQPGGFVGDPDIMDTWATSSVSPARDRVGARRTYSNAHSRWTCARRRTHPHLMFSSVVRAHFENDSEPWTNAAISGWVLDGSEDVEVEGQRRDSAWLAAGARLRRRALLGGAAVPASIRRSTRGR